MSPQIKEGLRILGYIIQARIEGDPIGGLFAVIEFDDAEHVCLGYFPVPGNEFETDPLNPDFMKFKLSGFQKRFMEQHPPCA